VAGVAWRSRAGVVAAAAVVLLVGLTGAASSETARAAHARGTVLTPAERKALHIVSVKAVGEDPTGLVVTVTFAGDIRHALGRGHLKQAAVAMILLPKQAPSISAGLMTQGAGVVGRTLRRTRSGEVGVLRDRRRLIFFIHGPGAGQVGQIVVKSFAKLAVATGARTPQSAVGGEPITLPRAEWDKAERHIADAEATLKHFEAAHLGTAGCKDLKSMRFQLRSIIGYATGAAEAFRMDEQKLAAAIDALKRKRPLPAPASAAVIAESVGAEERPERQDPESQLAWLERVRRDLKQTEARNEFTRLSALAMLRGVEAEIALCSPGTAPPPPTTFTLSIDSSGYDHTTHGEPAGRYPSTVCADFSTSPPQDSGRWHAVLTGPRAASAEGQLTSDGRARVVFGIPQPGSYHLLMSVDDGSGGPVTAGVDISVPTPPPSGKSKDCSAPPAPA
jgi:hypothetical protein